MSQASTLPRPGLREPRKLGDIVGHSNVVEGLQRRVLTRDRTAGVILHGPAGVGKRTLGRLYAKALLCEQPTGAGDSCGGCEVCRDFDRGTTMEDIVVDLAQKDAEKTIRYLIDRSTYQPWSERRVITLANADKSPPQAFDRLLPTLERQGTPTIFILLACDSKRVRLAGVSRCESYQLRPLTPGVARELLAMRFAEMGKTPDEATLDTLVAAGCGLPARLDGICARLVGVPDLTLASTRRALALDWTDHAVAYCGSFLTGSSAAADAPASLMDVDTVEMRRRTGALLTQLYTYKRLGSQMKIAVTDAALLTISETVLQELARELERCAALRGMPTESFWTSVVERWLSSDMVDECSKP